MITRFETYSLFHLECNEVCDVIEEPEVCPEGSIFHQFLERLDRSSVHSVNTVDSEHVTNVTVFIKM